MDSAVEGVFDNQDLRKLILTQLVRQKYREELWHGIQNLMEEAFVKKWYRYCHCELCNSIRQYHIATYGELL